MKLVVTYFALTVAIVVGYPFVESESEKIWPIPQIDGTIRNMTEKEALEKASHENEGIGASRRLTKVQYYLFTKSNPLISQEVEINNSPSLKSSNFNKDDPTVFMVHGWNGGYQAGQNRKIREALLLNGEGRNYNLFVVDWSVYALTANYVTARNRVKKAGEQLALFIDFLHTEGGLSFESLRLVGHSLGAHVVGFAGKNVENGKINKIVGLDPSLPLFNYEDTSSRLSSTDATYVETIQTNGMAAGFYSPIGHAAFYPNGGKSQPGCGIYLNGGCSHERAVDYYAEALALNNDNRFLPTKCDSFESFSNDNNSCNIPVQGIRMGSEENNGKGDSVYYLTTNSASIFGKGEVY